MKNEKNKDDDDAQEECKKQREREKLYCNNNPTYIQTSIIQQLFLKDMLICELVENTGISRDGINTNLATLMETNFAKKEKQDPDNHIGWRYSLTDEAKIELKDFLKNKDDFFKVNESLMKRIETLKNKKK